MTETLIMLYFFNNDIIFNDIDSDIVTFFSNDIGLNIINLNNVNLDDDNFFKILSPKLLVMLDLWFGLIDISNNKNLKKMKN